MESLLAAGDERAAMATEAEDADDYLRFLLVFTGELRGVLTDGTERVLRLKSALAGLIDDLTVLHRARQRGSSVACTPRAAVAGPDSSARAAIVQFLLDSGSTSADPISVAEDASLTEAPLSTASVHGHAHSWLQHNGTSGKSMSQLSSSNFTDGSPLLFPQTHSLGEGCLQSSAGSPSSQADALMHLRLRHSHQPHNSDCVTDSTAGQGGSRTPLRESFPSPYRSPPSSQGGVLPLAVYRSPLSRSPSGVHRLELYSASLARLPTVVPTTDSGPNSPITIPKANSPTLLHAAAAVAASGSAVDAYTAGHPLPASRGTSTRQVTLSAPSSQPAGLVTSSTPRASGIEESRGFTTGVRGRRCSATVLRGAFESTIVDTVRNCEAICKRFPLIPPPPSAPQLPAITEQTTGKQSRGSRTSGPVATPALATAATATAADGNGAWVGGVSWVVQELNRSVFSAGGAVRPQLPMMFLGDMVMFTVPSADVGRPALERSLSWLFTPFMPNGTQRRGHLQYQHEQRMGETLNGRHSPAFVNSGDVKAAGCEGESRLHAEHLSRLRQALVGQVFFILTGSEEVYSEAGTRERRDDRPPPLCHSISNLVECFCAQVREVYEVTVHPWQVLPFSISGTTVTRDLLCCLYQDVNSRPVTRDGMEATTQFPFNSLILPSVEGSIQTSAASTTSCNTTASSSTVPTPSRSIGGKQSILLKRKSDAAATGPLQTNGASSPPRSAAESSHPVTPLQSAKHKDNPGAALAAAKTVAVVDSSPSEHPHHQQQPQPQKTCLLSSPAKPAAAPASPSAGVDGAVSYSSPSPSSSNPPPSQLSMMVDRYCLEVFGPRFMANRDRKFTDEDLLYLVFYDAMSEQWYTCGAYQLSVTCQQFERHVLSYILSGAALSLMTWCSQLLPLLPEAGERMRAKVAKISERLAVMRARQERVEESILCHKLASPHTSALAMHDALQRAFDQLATRFLRNLRVMMVLCETPPEMDLAQNSPLAAAYTRLREAIARYWAFYVDGNLEQTFRLLHTQIAALRAEHDERVSAYCAAHPETASVLASTTAECRRSGSVVSQTLTSPPLTTLSTERRTKFKVPTTSVAGVPSEPVTLLSLNTVKPHNERRLSEAERRAARAKLARAIDATYMQRLTALVERRAGLERQLVVLLSQLNTEIINCFIAVLMSEFGTLTSAINTELHRWREVYETLLAQVAASHAPKDTVPSSYLRRLLHSSGGLSLLSMRTSHSFRGFVTNLRAVVCEDQVRALVRFRETVSKHTGVEASNTNTATDSEADRGPADAFPSAPVSAATVAEAAALDEFFLSNTTRAEESPTHHLARRTCTFIRKWLRSSAENRFTAATPTLATTLFFGCEEGEGAGPSADWGFPTGGAVPFMASEIPPELILASAGAPQFHGVRRNTARFVDLPPQKDRPTTACGAASEAAERVAGEGSPHAWSRRLAAWRADTPAEQRPMQSARHPALWVLLDVWDEVLLSSPYGVWVKFDYEAHAKLLNEVGLQLLAAQQAWRGRLESEMTEVSRYLTNITEEVEQLTAAESSVASTVSAVFRNCNAIAKKLDAGRNAALASVLVSSARGV